MATVGFDSGLWPNPSVEELSAGLGADFKAGVRTRLQRISESLNPDEVAQCAAYLQGMFNAAAYLERLTDTTARDCSRAVHEASLKRLAQLGYEVDSVRVAGIENRTLN